MTKDEWRKTVKHVYERSLLPGLARRAHRLDPFEYFERCPWTIHRLARAMRGLRFIDDYFDDDDEITAAFTQSFLGETLDSLADGLTWNKRLIVDSGVADTVQKHFTELVDGMDAEDMPEEDSAVLRLSGSADPAHELSAIVDRVKTEKEAILRRYSEGGFPLSLRRAIDCVLERKKQLESGEESGNKLPVKRWFKGLGGICQGTMLTIVDGTLVAGMWTIALPVESKTIGAVVSITSGIGSILTGFGELRGE